MIRCFAVDLGLCCVILLACWRFAACNYVYFVDVFAYLVCLLGFF